MRLFTVNTIKKECLSDAQQLRKTKNRISSKHSMIIIHDKNKKVNRK